MIFKKPKETWNLIDERLRFAIMKRNVTVKFLVNGHATHSSLMFDAIKALVNNMNKKGQVFVQAKSFGVSLKGALFDSILNVQFP